MIQISVINEGTTITDAEVQAMIAAFSAQWNVDLASVWGIELATFTFIPKGQNPPAGSWWCVFLDNSDQAGALAYHDLTNEGLPISKVFVKTLQADNASVSVGATHELCEMAVDPWLNGAYQDEQGIFWAGEICDPVEDDKYGYMLNGVLVTDFVTPDWFGLKTHGAKIDFQGHASKPFEVLSGGYAQKFNPKIGWQQITGAEAEHVYRKRNPAKGSRRNRRFHGWHVWKNSKVDRNE